MKAVYIDQTGGAEVLRYGDFPKPEPAAGQVLVKIAASGVNFIDTYHRSGLYKIPLPAVLGSEGAGVVAAAGAGVTGFKPGDRVAWAMARGSYAEYAAVPQAVLVRVPEGIELRDAAAVMLQGMTAHYLTRSTFPLKDGDTCLVHAAAGGTGALIVQMAKQIGARVIGTVSTPGKEAIARAAGADDVIFYNEQDFAVEARRLTDGRGVDVVYDGVGKSTFEKSLDSLRPRGMLVLFGYASGPVTSVDPSVLNTKGSLYLTRPSLAHYIATREELQWRAQALFELVAGGKLTVRIDATFPLERAVEAHHVLEGRGTTGKLLLKV